MLGKNTSAEPIKDGEKTVKSWGFKHVFTWTDQSHTHYKPHAHDGLTTHLVLSGNFTVCYPEEEPDKKENFGPGSRVDVPAGKVHEVWIGDQGCTYVIGE